MPNQQVADKGILEEADLAIKKIFGGNSIRRVLLVSPPDIPASLFDYDTTKRGRSNNYPPYGLGVIARHLLDNGIDVRISNLNHEILKKCIHSNDASQFDFEETWKSKLAEDVDSFQPDLIGVTCLFTVTHPSLVNVCKQISELTPPWRKSRAKIPLAVGGVHVTHDVEKVLEEIPDAEFVFLHESELSFLHFIEVVNCKSPLEKLSQLIINTPDAKLDFKERKTPEAETMDVIPAYELMEVSENALYGTLGSWYGFKDRGTPIATVLSNRGCRAACTFCNVRTFNGVGVRHRSVESVLDELTILKNKYGVGHFIWLDDDLLHDEKRAIKLFNGMVERNLEMTWDATNGLIAHSCKEEVISAAAKSGAIGVFLGVETGNPEILKQIKKPGTVETFRGAAKVIKRYEEIHSRILLIIGFPGETLGKIFDTVDLVEEMDLDWCNIAILQPWKSTPLYDQMVEQGLVGEEGTLKNSAQEKKVAPYNLGPYSKQRALERGTLDLPPSIQSVLEGLSVDTVPTPDELDNIWFYMNYRVNFFKLFQETSKVKLGQQCKWLRYVHTLTAPDNALVMYFYGFLQYMTEGKADCELIQKLEARLRGSDYWKERFDFFGLSVEHLRENVFPLEKIKETLDGISMSFYDQVGMVKS
jgi:radical SAM superfamily enzyme YgiQ (UPF0313 family)